MLRKSKGVDLENQNYKWPWSKFEGHLKKNLIWKQIRSLVYTVNEKYQHTHNLRLMAINVPFNMSVTFWLRCKCNDM